MFTGLVEEMGVVKNLSLSGKSGVLTIVAKKVLENTAIGDSIAVNGICLTVVKLSGNTFCADVMAETVERSSLAKLKSGDRVNLERAMAADGRFGGHIVSGHIDGTGRISNIKEDENAVWYTIEAPTELIKYIVEKGSIAIDGISLTVAYVDEKRFKVSIIPHTRAQTTLHYRRVGDIVNLECDVVGKYVERLMGFRNANSNTLGKVIGSSRSGLTLDFLVENGF